MKPRQEEYDALLRDQVARQNAISDFGFQSAREDRARYQQDFVPVEASLIAESLGLPASPAAQAAKEALFQQRAAEATADVQQAYANAEGSLARQMSRAGTSANAGNYGANATQIALQRARDLAFGATNARRAADKESWAKRADVANLGRGIATSNVATANLGLSASGMASNTGGAGLANARANTAVMGQGFNTGMQAGMNAGSLMNTQFNNQIASDQAGGDIFGTLLGTGLGMFTGSYGAALGRRLGR